MDSGDDRRRPPSPPSPPRSSFPIEVSPSPPSPPSAKLLATDNTYFHPNKEIRPGDEDHLPPSTMKTAGKAPSIGENLSDEALCLPPEVLYEIFRHTWALNTLSSFTGVCKAWESVILPEALQFKKSLYLIMPHDVEDEQRGFYEIYSGKIINKILPLLKGNVILSSCEGWLLVMGYRSDTVAIVNPLTGQHFILPKIDLDRSLKVNGLLSCSPCRPKCKIVITVEAAYTTTVYSLKHGHDKDWVCSEFRIKCGDNKTVLGFLGDLVCICDPIKCETYYCHVFDKTCAGKIEVPDRKGGRILISKNDIIFVLHGRELFSIQVNKHGEKTCLLVTDEKVIFTEDYRASFCDPNAFSKRENIPHTFSFPQFYFHVTRRSRYIHMYDFSTRMVVQYPCSFNLIHNKTGKCHWFEPCLKLSAMARSVALAHRYTSCSAPVKYNLCSVPKKVCTVFISGFPSDMSEREIANLLRWFPGALAPQQSRSQGSLVLKVQFSTEALATDAKNKLHNLLYDPDEGIVLQAQLASNDMPLERD